MSSSNSDYSEDYDEDYEYSEPSSDDSSRSASPAPGAVSRPGPPESGNFKSNHERLVHESGSFMAAFGLSDLQKVAIRRRRAVWDAVLKDSSVVLSTAQCTLLQKCPQSDADLLTSAIGPYATVLSASCQTGNDVHNQDTQTSFILTAVQGSQAPQDLMEDLQGSQATANSSHTSSRNAQLKNSGTLDIYTDSQGIKGLSEASTVLPAPPTAFPQRQIISHLALSRHYQQPVVAVIYSQLMPAEPDDGNIISVTRDNSTSSARLLGLQCESVVALWSLREASTNKAPSAVLMCHSTLSCCDLHCVETSQHEAGAGTWGLIVVGGCTDGSIWLWDTGSHTDMHCAWQDPAIVAAKASKGAKLTPSNPKEPALRHTAVYPPVYSTICPENNIPGTIPSPNRGNQGEMAEPEGFEQLEPVNQVAVVKEGASSTATNQGAKRYNASSSLNFSVLVLSATGVVSMWAVVVARGAHKPSAGSFLLDTHGASVRLVKLHRVMRHGTPRASMMHHAGAFAPAACLAVTQSTPKSFLVGDCTGSVTRGAIHGPQPSPQVYNIQDSYSHLSDSMNAVHPFSVQAVGSRVLTVAVHPSTPEVLLVAYDMGLLAVFVSHQRSAVRVMSCAASLVGGVWLQAASDTCAAVTKQGNIALFKVTSTDLEPYKEFTLGLPEGVECTAVTASAWEDDKCGKENAALNGTEGTGKKDVIVLGLSTGSLVYHVVGEAQGSSKYSKSDSLVSRLLGAA